MYYTFQAFQLIHQIKIGFFKYYKYLGSINIANCQIQRFIPIWLIVAGVFSIIQQLLQLLNYWNKRNTPEEEQEANKTSQAGSTLLGCFNIAWFICGQSTFAYHSKSNNKKLYFYFYIFFTLRVVLCYLNLKLYVDFFQLLQLKIYTIKI